MSLLQQIADGTASTDGRSWATGSDGYDETTDTVADQTTVTDGDAWQITGTGSSSDTGTYDPDSDPESAKPDADEIVYHDDGTASSGGSQPGYDSPQTSGQSGGPSFDALASLLATQSQPAQSGGMDDQTLLLAGGGLLVVVVLVMMTQGDS